MAGLDSSAELPSGPSALGIFGDLARQQYSALSTMRWAQFSNGLRSNKGILELGARVLTYTVYGGTGIGISTGIGFATYLSVSHSGWKYLPIFFWIAFVIWQLVPIVMASFQEQFDLGILLRFPVSFSSYYLLYVIFGLVDVSTITGVFCCTGIWVGATIARPGETWWLALALAGFGVFNILLVRAIFAWIDRWLAQRRTREILGAIFLLLALSAQLLNPALREGRHTTHTTPQERIASQRQTFDRIRPWLQRANEVQRWLPAGSAAQAASTAAAGSPGAALESFGVLGIYSLLFGAVLGLRLRSEYAGESLGEAPSRKKAARREGAWLQGGSGPIAAILEKELRTLVRTLPLIYAIGAPLVLVVVFSGAFNRAVISGHRFEFAFPICLIYAQLGFIQLFYNSLGAEGMGIQLYFLSPTPIRTVLLAKNIFHSLLFALVILTASVLATLRIGPPSELIAVTSIAWLLFSLPCNLAAGNLFSLLMPYRINPGRLTRQRGSQANGLLSFLIQVGVMGIGALVILVCWFTDTQWLAAPIYLVLAAVAVFVWLRVLRNSEGIANRRRDELIATIAKLG